MAAEVEYDAQDSAETFDETNLTEDGQDIANIDEMENVYDVTVSDEDDDEDDEDAPQDEADFDEEAFDLDTLEAERDDEGREVDSDQLDSLSDEDDPDRYAADNVSTAAVEPASFESNRLDDDDLEALGYGDEDPSQDVAHQTINKPPAG